MRLKTIGTPFLLNKLDIEMNHDGFQLEVVLDSLANSLIPLRRNRTVFHSLQTNIFAPANR